MICNVCTVKHAERFHEKKEYSKYLKSFGEWREFDFDFINN